MADQCVFVNCPFEGRAKAAEAHVKRLLGELEGLREERDELLAAAATTATEIMELRDILDGNVLPADTYFCKDVRRG